MTAATATITSRVTATTAVNTFKVRGIRMIDFPQEEIDKMPICFAFHPDDIESQKNAEIKQKELE